MKPLRVVRDGDEMLAVPARVVPLFRGEQQGVSPLQMFGAGWVDKKECARRLWRSTRWVELQMRKQGAAQIPHKKMDEAVQQSSVMFPWARVEAWWNALGQNRNV